jgi:hypothetical protein
LSLEINGSVLGFLRHPIFGVLFVLRQEISFNFGKQKSEVLFVSLLKLRTQQVKNNSDRLSCCLAVIKLDVSLKLEISFADEGVLVVV